jgi:hypothetical protein
MVGVVTKMFCTHVLAKRRLHFHLLLFPRTDVMSEVKILFAYGTLGFPDALVNYLGYDWP